MNETQTKLVMFFIFFTMVSGLVGYIFRGFVPDLTNSVLDRPSGVDVGLLEFAGALFTLMVFNVSSNLYVLSVIIDAYAFLGVYLIASFVLDR